MSDRTQLQFIDDKEWRDFEDFVRAKYPDLRLKDLSDQTENEGKSQHSQLKGLAHIGPVIWCLSVTFYFIASFCMLDSRTYILSATVLFIGTAVWRLLRANTINMVEDLLWSNVILMFVFSIIVCSSRSYLGEILIFPIGAVALSTFDMMRYLYRHHLFILKNLGKEHSLG
ncbi:hypothetical protein [Flexibacterium corallicola]|uniref:hypothetical protein n=1 Tax=Flexibacterium corallicola TaxID=3037259 RepID=UPI00286FAE60|nr:hypothetical protein [Pseudovibrio sp. M1P-2-3]